MSEEKTTQERPLSPHLQTYKPQMTSAMSITHRATGVALVIGSLLVIWWLVAAAMGEEAYNCVKAFTESTIGTVMLFCWTVALFYHLCNGIRHLFWGIGFLFKLQNAFRAGWFVLFMTALLTGLVWCPVFWG